MNSLSVWNVKPWRTPFFAWGHVSLFGFSFWGVWWYIQVNNFQRVPFLYHFIKDFEWKFSYVESVKSFDKMVIKRNKKFEYFFWRFDENKNTLWDLANYCKMFFNQVTDPRRVNRIVIQWDEWRHHQWHSSYCSKLPLQHGQSKVSRLPEFSDSFFLIKNL